MDPIAAIEAACSPDKTKALFMGECGVSWSTFKDVQAAILEQARLNMGWSCSGCGSTHHILWLRDQGHISCCPERELVPPNSVLDSGSISAHRQPPHNDAPAQSGGQP